MFVAKFEESILRQIAIDVSIEEEFQNYFFGKDDPPQARKVTKSEIRNLLSYATFSKLKIGGLLMKPPIDPIAIGISIFWKS